MTEPSVGANTSPLRRPGIRSGDAFGVLICFSAVMEYVPLASVRTAMFVVAMVWFVIVSWFDPAPIARTFDDVGCRIFFFLCVAISSVCWAVVYGTALQDWIRGLIPFLTLGVWFLVRVNVPEDVARLEKWLIASACVWAIRIVMEALFRVSDGVDLTATRLTLLITDSVLPFPLMALPLLLWSVRPVPQALRSVAVAVLTGLVIWCAYRSAIGLVFVLFAVALWRRWHSDVILLALFVFLPAFYAILFLFPEVGQDGFFGMLISRFSNTTHETESVRVREWIFVLEQLKESPLLGMGLGFQVPGAVTFEGVDVMEGVEIPASVGFVHSSLAYLLMDLGVIGTALYFSIFFFGLRPRVFFRASNFGAAMALLMLFAFSFVEVSFRLIQVNLMYVALLKILVNNSGPASHTGTYPKISVQEK